MTIHYLQHVPFEGLGYIESWAKESSCSVSSTQLYIDATFPNMNDFDWLIIMGGPMSVNETDIYPWLVKEKAFVREAILNDKVVLGICLGAQIIASVLGAKVYKAREKEIGWYPIFRDIKSLDSGFAKLLPDMVDVFHWHGETFDLPDRCILLARSKMCENQAFIYHEKVIGLQFHLESTFESIKELIDHSKHEMVEAPHIQSAETMLSDENRIEKINKIMERILKYMLQKTNV